MNNTLNKTKLLATISNSNNGELFDALFAGDVERVGGNAKAAAKSVINTLAWYLAGNIEAVTATFADSPLASQVDNAAALILKACNDKKDSGFAGVSQFFGDDKTYEKPARKGDGSEKLKISHVEKWLAENGVSVRFNVITQSAEIEGYAARSLQKGNLLNTLPTVIYNDIVDEYKGVTQELIYSYLRVIIEANAYNPVLDKLAAVNWDGKDRLSDVWKLIGLDADTSDNDFSHTLFTKWMMQSLCMLHNGDDYTFGADGVLTLNGAQGIGKTTLLRSMAMDRSFFRESQRLDDKDKDTARRCVTTWIAELGELDCTLKSDLGYLKGFITADIDSYRLPYGRCDVTVPRHSSLAATVNGDSYLIDPTGNRRYWTITLSHIDIEGVMSFDWLQTWKQIEHMINSSPLDVSQVFRLTKNEQKMLEDRNRGVERGLPGEDEIADILCAGGDTSTWEYMTTSRFKELFPALRGYSARAIGNVFKKRGIASKSKRVDGTPVKCYLLPKETTAYIPGLVADSKGEEENIPF